MNIYKSMPSRDQLLRDACQPRTGEIMEVNAHLHSPYSFSAFDSIRQAIEKAVAEGVMIAGINDFNTMNGYAEWADECLRRRVFPLFNIEFIALNRKDQENGILVNDPNNPGRTYLSGKGLAFPQIISGRSLEQLNKIKSEANRHVEKLCARLNDHLLFCGSPFIIDYYTVLKDLTMGNIRERHLARALRMKTEEHFADRPAQSAFYQKLFEGEALKSDPEKTAAVENEIRGNLLKAGGPAFVPENPDSFPEVDDICRIIIDAGGIPAYPFLGDDANGNFTDFERDPDKALETLRNRGICSVEFIPTRNSLDVLEKYAGFCRDKGFIVTFGTEHNTPLMEPLKVFASGRMELTPRLKETGYLGACIIAAHQYLVGTGEKGYRCDNMAMNNRDEYIRLGHALIMSITNN